VCWDRITARPLSAAISWQDRRNAGWLSRLAGHEADVRRRTGLPLSPHYGAGKLRWCLDHLDEVRAAAAGGRLAAGPLSSFLTARLLDGRACVVDPANAARTLLFDPDALDWAPELLELFGIPRNVLPACVSTAYRYGSLTIDGQSVPLATCTGDQSAAAFAFGRPADDVALVNIGTGAFVQRVAPRTVAAPDGLLRSVLRSDVAGALRSHEGTVNGAAAALEWLRERIAIDVDRAVPQLAGRPLDRNAPAFINGVGGLGAPWWLPAFPTDFDGDAEDDLARVSAVLESIAFLIATNLDALAAASPLERVLVSGGLARSDYLCRVLASTSGLPVERRVLAEATARGAAFLAAGAPATWAPVPVERRFEPEASAALAARRALWRAAMARRGAA
jgi:glycerol kinase